MSLSTRLLIMVLVGLALFQVGYWRGAKAERNAEAARDKRAVETTIERHDVAATVGHGVEREGVRAEAQQERHTRKLLQEAHADAKANPSSAGCRLDDQRLRRWNDANNGADRPAASVADGTSTRETASAGEWAPGRSGGQSHRVGGDLPPDSGALQSAGEMAGEDE